MIEQSVSSLPSFCGLVLGGSMEANVLGDWGWQVRVDIPRSTGSGVSETKDEREGGWNPREKEEPGGTG